MSDTYATQPHYQHHINHHTTGTPIDPQTTKPTTQPTWVASRGDADRLANAGWSNIVLVEHGAGQRYVANGSVLDASNQRAPNHAVRHWIGPNAMAWSAVESRLPNANPWFVSAHVYALMQRRADPDLVSSTPTVGFAVHWANPLCPESRGGWPATAMLVQSVKRRWPDVRVVIMPHHKLNVGGIRRTNGVRQYPDVLVDPDWPSWSPHIDVLVADNTSVMWEAAALGIPVIGYRPPHWRPWGTMPLHGFRFRGPHHIELESDHTAKRDIITDIGLAIEYGVGHMDRVLGRTVRDIVYPNIDNTPELLASITGALTE